MKLIPTLALSGLALLGLSLSACTTTGQKVLENLQDCNRKYDGTINAGLTGANFTGTIKVECLNADLAKAKAAGVAGSGSPQADDTN